MKALLIVGLLILGSPAMAQDRVLGFTEGPVQIRNPGETAWRSVPSASLPPNAAIRARSQDNWVEIVGADGTPLQVRWIHVRQGAATASGPGGCVPSASRAGAAGSQGLGARGC